ncbi:MAG: hypothetical protein H6712_25140 [Myxococcales bacterium]|nr:hypothetical protein [Myxococcales bacterium]MCB9717162.1 hypothetical protein [Myxococcales bacterium]
MSRGSRRIGFVGAVTTLAVPAALGLGCGTEDRGDDLGDLDNDRIVEIANDTTCVTLYAGQTIDVGSVCVSIDNTVDTSGQCGAGATGVMTVQYDTTGGWTLSETHLAVGDALSDIPANRKGNPQIGHFPYAGPAADGATSVSYQVPLCTVGLDGADEACDPVNAFFAAHAVVEHDNGDGSVHNETAWGDGERLVRKGSWAEYFNMSLECKVGEEPPPPPEKDNCETAFALAGDGTETCFIGADFDGDGQDDGISRWGWSNGPLAAGSSRQWPVYAAAGQCDIGRGELVGYLSVDYDGANAQVTFDRVGNYVLAEEQVYIGNEPLPRDVNGDYTVAPGQYPIVIDLDDATQTSNTVTGLSGDIYVVYHAVACGGGGDDGGGSDDGGDPKPPDPLESLNDEFDGDLSLWDIYNPQDISVSVANGQMTIEPTSTGGGWYMGYQGGHVNQTVTGNFTITTYVEVTNLNGGSTFPGDPYRVGGLMVRDPDSPTVNSYHMAIGNMGTGSLTVVSKSTDDSYSTIGNQAWTDDLAEMRLCRVGDDIQGLIRLPGDPWRIIDWHVRPDMPETVVTGPVAYGWNDTTPDLRATCDWVRFATIETLQDCMHD